MAAVEAGVRRWAVADVRLRRIADIRQLADSRRMTEQFAGSRMDRTSGIIMLVATGLALLLGFVVGPPNIDAIVIGTLLVLGLAVVCFGAWALRLCAWAG